MLRVDALGRTVAGLSRDQLMEPMVATALHGNLLPRATDHDDMLHARGILQRVIDVFLQRDHGAAAIPPIGGQNGFRLSVVHSVAQGLSGKSAKNDAVRESETRA